MTSTDGTIDATANDGHRWQLLATLPDAAPRARLLWLPALGVAARHYTPFAQALAARGVAVYVHEWRGNGSSSLRPSRSVDWGYRELLCEDLPASLAALGDIDALRIGGHSLGGQLACCFAGLQPHRFAGQWLVASGSPYWRAFPRPLRYALPLVYRFLPWIARRQGVLHGRRLRFAGTEARGLIADWARVGLNNRYAGAGLEIDLEAALAAVRAPTAGIVLGQDRLAPEGTLRQLLGKLGGAVPRVAHLDARQLGTQADHFAWMKRPDAVAETLLMALD